MPRTSLFIPLSSCQRPIHLLGTEEEFSVEDHKSSFRRRKSTRSPSRRWSKPAKTITYVWGKKWKKVHGWGNEWNFIRVHMRRPGLGRRHETSNQNRKGWANHSRFYSPFLYNPRAQTQCTSLGEEEFQVQSRKSSWSKNVRNRSRRRGNPMYRWNKEEVFHPVKRLKICLKPPGEDDDWILSQVEQRLIYAEFYLLSIKSR